ncbi:MAG: efflux RND transporter permease subunit [Planctomycetes bacterium]|nr:efflux RND transporter permease subunit [Planctomycetota bacterium]
MLSKFFVDRPIFATVLSLLIVLVGALAVVALPVAQFPPIAPPTVRIRATCPGASAETVAQSLAAPIGDVYMAMQAYLSALYINDFVRQVASIASTSRQRASIERRPRTSAAFTCAPSAETWCRSRCSARLWRPRCVASTWTSTSRSACSRWWVSPRRTRF